MWCPSLPGPGDLVTKAINKIAEEIWGFADTVLGSAFKIIDAHAQPKLLYTPDGPLGAVYPITLWIGITLAIGLAFAQIARVAWNGGQGIGEAVKGIVLFALVTASGLAVLNAAVSASGAVANGIISAAFDVDNFQGLSGDSTFMAGAVKSLTGMTLGLMSLFLVIPFAFGLICEVLIREGSLLVLAATYPIICAGLVHEKFARWYWTGLRWILALICMTPVVAIAMAVGHSLAVGAGSGKGDDALDAVGVALVSGVISLVSLICPLVLFKLFAFVDPNTMAGQKLRGSLPGASSSGSGGGGASAADGGSPAEAGAESAGTAGAGAVDSGGEQAEVGELGGEGGIEQGLEGSEGELSGGQTGVLAAMGAAVSAMHMASEKAAGGSADAAEHAGSSLDAVGAGHPGSPSAIGSEDSRQQEPEADEAQDGSQSDPQQEPSGPDAQGPPPGDNDPRDGGGGPGEDPAVDLGKGSPAEQGPFQDDPPDVQEGQDSGGRPGGGGGKPPSGPGRGGAVGGGEAGAAEAAAV